MTEHAKLSPSSAGRWLTCTSSVYLEQEMPPEQESPYAAEGTEAHALLERAIKSGSKPSILEPDHPAAKDVDVFYEFVEPFMLSEDFAVLSEVKVTLTPDVWGTADAVIIGNKELWVVDYKHGKGVAVELPSKQLEIYAAAAVKTMAPLLPGPVERVYTVIVQPRKEHPDGPLRTLPYNNEDLDARVNKEILPVVENIIAGKVSFCPSEDACRWCRCKGSCKAQADMAFEIAKSNFNTVDGETRVEAPPKGTADTLKPEELAAIILGTSFVKSFLDAVGDRVRDGLLAGESIPGLKLVEGRSIRKWGRLDDEGNPTTLTDEEVIEKLTKECKLKLAQIAPPKLLGPAPIEKLIDPKARNGKKKAELLNSIIVKPSGKPTVVADTDPRKSISPHFTEVQPSTDPLG